VIQSVLDVADETPLSKRPELPTAFHRSILILTPSRALKFTAVNAERHALWMNALSFLAESDRVQLPELPPLMPPVPDEYSKSQVKRQRSPSFGRSHLRDSVNLAKGRQPSLLRSVSAQNSSSAETATQTVTNGNAATQARLRLVWHRLSRACARSRQRPSRQLHPPAAAPTEQLLEEATHQRSPHRQRTAAGPQKTA
jgi:hypothetical protein